MSDSVQFNNIYLASKSQPKRGMLKVRKEGFAWRPVDDDKVITIGSSDVKEVLSTRVARGSEIRIILHDGNRIRLSGFQDQNLQELDSFTKSHLGISVQAIDLSVKGWNWGDPKFLGNTLAFTLDNKSVFEIPLSDVSSAVQKRNDITVELNQADPIDDQEQVVEMRFFIPPTYALEGEESIIAKREARKVQRAKEKEMARKEKEERRQRAAANGSAMELSDEDDDDEDDEDEEDDIQPDEIPASRFKALILSKADVAQMTGDVIVSLANINCLTPRGRYQADFHPTLLRLHGASQDFKIPYSTIERVYVLPKPDRRVFLVISLGTPIKQGQTRHSFIVFSVDQYQREDVKILSPDGDEASRFASKVNNLLQEADEFKLDDEGEFDSASSEKRLLKVLTVLFHAATDKKAIKPSNSYSSADGSKAVKCSFKTNDGFIFPLERGVIFAHKPIVIIRYEDIGTVSCSRASGVNKTFDLDFHTKDQTKFNFNNIPKQEQERLVRLLESKNVTVKQKSEPSQGGLGDMDLDDDLEAGDSYLRRMKAEGRERDEIGDDEDSEEDEDFNVNAAGGSDDEPEEEFDSDVEGSSGSGDDSDDSDGDSDGSEKEERRPKKKERSSESRRSNSKSSSKSDGKEKKKRAKRDKDAPKQPQSSYLLFTSDVRAKLKAENPSAGVSEMGKLMGEAWNKLSDSDKQPYVEKAAKLRAEYDIANAEFKKKKALEGNNASKSDEDDDQGAERKKKEKKESHSASGSSSSVDKSKYKTPEFIDSDEE